MVKLKPAEDKLKALSHFALMSFDSLNWSVQALDYLVIFIQWLRMCDEVSFEKASVLTLCFIFKNACFMNGTD